MNSMGRKIFFLYPHSVIQEELVVQIVQNEFEIYLVYDHMRLKKLLERYEDSIVFINIDENMKEQQWIAYVRALVNSEELSNLQIGILTYNENKDLAQTYLIDIGISAGYIQLKLGLKESLRIILQTLMANEAKGKRRFVRAKCPEAVSTEFNADILGNTRQGSIVDISSAGMACVFDNAVDLSARTKLEKIQLKLRSRIVIVTGIIAGNRNDEEGHTLYVVLFTAYVSTDAKKRISDFIYRTLQNEIERELKSIKID
jgi:hypothetical protein